MGSGDQFMPWVELGDAVRAIEHCLATPSLAGPVNVVSPIPATNAEFTVALAAALHRPAFFHMPELLVNLVFGEMGRELLLSSQRCSAAKLEGSGFKFRCWGISEGVEQALMKSS